MYDEWPDYDELKDDSHYQEMDRRDHLIGRIDDEEEDE